LKTKIALIRSQRIVENVHDLIGFRFGIDKLRTKPALQCQDQALIRIILYQRLIPTIL